ncbi:hypothetical protein AAFF_G00020200 [Aldrovandia affinis]|uniref:Uncharacterized protein n=1 Tax=Aldrovandia affinis TaxID=143900 RepID=A0AAD7S5E6_9TELE|nr:hypothetical protein AAFF_G00020200 [Aldrovandia affinis]
MQYAGSLEIHREVFSTTEGDEMPTIPGDVARNRLPLKRAVVEMELSSAYVVPTKRPPTASSAEELE